MDDGQIEEKEVASKTPARLYDEIRHSPFLQALQREFDAMFDRVRPGLASVLASDAEPGALIPAMDVSETPQGMRVVVETPGVAREDLEVSVAGQVLTIRGRKSAGREEEGRDWHLTERRTGSFLRTVPLGFEPDGDAVTARFEDGVLTVEVRKPAEATAAARRIEIA